MANHSRSLEAALRARTLLRELDGSSPAARDLRVLRAIEVLERIGTKEAQRLLKNLGSEEPVPRLAGEARAALKRLAR